MIGCLQTCVHKQPIIALYFEFENELKFYNLGARSVWTIFIVHLIKIEHDAMIEIINLET